MTKRRLSWIALVLVLACIPLFMGAYEDTRPYWYFPKTVTFSDPLDVTSGGTGLGTLTDHGVVLGSGTSDVSITDSGSNGEVLVSNGSAADPDWEYVPRQNLLKNTGWVAASNSDTNRGKCTLAYDAGTDVGGGNTPDPGDVATGATSGAVGKVILVTTSTGTWAGDNAAGTIQLGACAGRFQNNETVNFTDLESCLVNQPDSAAGPDLIRNGDFSVDTDPPPGWTAVTATLTTVIGGQVGNCMTVASSGAALGQAYQDVTTVVGKTYYFYGYFKKGTSDTGKFMIGITTDADSLWDSGALSDAAWAAKSQYVTATATTTRITCQTTDATITETSLFDELSFYEVTPSFTAADGLCFDMWSKDTTLDVYQQHNDTTYTKNGSFYAAKLVPSAQNDFMYYPNGYSTQAYWYEQFQGRTVTFGAWVLSSTASDVYLQTYDGAAVSSSAHTGGGTFEWLEVTDTISASATTVYFQVVHTSATPGIAYISQPMLCFGSSIGAGNYVPEADKQIPLEKKIDSQAFHNKTGANGFSDVAITTLVLTSDTGGCIGVGAKGVRFYIKAQDSGSAGTACYWAASHNITTTPYEFLFNLLDTTNDISQFGVGYTSCNSSGNYQYQIDATGGSTFDISSFYYTWMEWR